MQNTDRLCMGCMNDNGGEQICPICGYDKDTPQNAAFLSTHTWLKNRYLVGKVLDSNGEGVTYFGWDNESDTIVHIREYCPTGLCVRNADGTVKINEGAEYTFNEGLLTFTELAKTLSSLKDVDALLKVYDVFEEGGTAYYVVQTVSGITLREFLLRNGGTLKWEQARPLFMPLLSALKTLHGAGIIHRGISPDTLLVGRDGIIRITGFCIPEARTARTNMTAQLFSGFAAIEQYGFDGQQGSWTDVYGFAATLFRTLIGNPPPEATERVTNDNMTIPGNIAQELPPHVLSALANALQILPEDRTQSVEDFRNELTSDSELDEYNDDDEYYERRSGNKRYGVIAALVTVVIIAVAFGVLAMTVFRDVFFPTNEHINAEQPGSSTISLLPMENTDKMFEVPLVIGTTYAAASTDPNYMGVFTYEIIGAEFSTDYDRGLIMSQETEAGTTAERGTVIQVKISLGTPTVTMPNLVNLTLEEAKDALWQAGFFYSSISVMETYDVSATPEAVVETEPKAGSEVNVMSGIKIFINTYKDESSSEPASSVQPSSSQNHPTSSRDNNDSSRRPSSSSDISSSDTSSEDNTVTSSDVDDTSTDSED